MANEKPCTEHAERVTALEVQYKEINKSLAEIKSAIEDIKKRNSFATLFYGAVIAIGSFSGALAGAMELRKFFP